MIWKTTSGRDAAEAIRSGNADDDLDGLEAAIARRRDALAYPPCPDCGKPLKVPHFHGLVKVERIAPEMPADRAAVRALPPNDLQGPLP